MTKTEFLNLPFVERSNIRNDFYIALDIFNDCYPYLCHAISTLTDTRHNPSYLMSIVENGRIWNIHKEISSLLDLDNSEIVKFKKSYWMKFKRDCTGFSPVQLVFSIFE